MPSTVSSMPRPFLENFPNWDRYVILLGAGASKDAGLPIVRDFSDPEYLAKAVGAQKNTGIGDDRPDLFEVCHQIRESGLGFEQLLAKYHREGDGEKFSKLLNYYQILFLITDNVAGVVLDPETGQLSGNYYLVLGEILRQIPQPVIITFNHDLWVEHGLRRRVHYGSIESRMDFMAMPLIDIEHIGFREPEERIPLLKLHGSFGYLYCQHCDRFLVGEDFLWYVAPPLSCRICGRTLMPSYVPPLEEKDPNLYLESWEDARSALREAELVLVIGYSLPVYDLAARSMLSELNPDAMIYIVDPFYGQVRKNYESLNARILTGGAMHASRFITQWAVDPTRLRGHW